MEIIMKFTFKNKKEIQNLYLHDSLFKGFTYDYEERKLSLSIMNEEESKKIVLTFSDILFLKMEAYGLWGKGVERINSMWLEEKSDYMNKAQKLLAEEKEKYPECYEHAPAINYFQINLQVLSGDEISIICESMDWEEEII
ncbi:MAG TPA: hypothetical protein IAA10_09410 [Candidatus Blautia intestinavium]|nr:hypothetical protein [Candidatus Blautia intestinavium]